MAENQMKIYDYINSGKEKDQSVKAIYFTESLPNTPFFLKLTEFQLLPPQPEFFRACLLEAELNHSDSVLRCENYSLKTFPFPEMPNGIQD